MASVEHDNDLKKLDATFQLDNSPHIPHKPPVAHTAQHTVHGEPVRNTSSEAQHAPHTNDVNMTNVHLQYMQFAIYSIAAQIAALPQQLTSAIQYAVRTTIAERTFSGNASHTSSATQSRSHSRRSSRAGSDDASAPHDRQSPHSPPSLIGRFDSHDSHYEYTFHGDPVFQAPTPCDPRSSPTSSLLAALEGEGFPINTLLETLSQSGAILSPTPRGAYVAPRTAHRTQTHNTARQILRARNQRAARHAHVRWADGPRTPTPYPSLSPSPSYSALRPDSTPSRASPPPHPHQTLAEQDGEGRPDDPNKPILIATLGNYVVYMSQAPLDYMCPEPLDPCTTSSVSRSSQILGLLARDLGDPPGDPLVQSMLFNSSTGCSSWDTRPAKVYYAVDTRTNSVDAAAIVHPLGSSRIFPNLRVGMLYAAPLLLVTHVGSRSYASEHHIYEAIRMHASRIGCPRIAIACSPSNTRYLQGVIEHDGLYKKVWHSIALPNAVQNVISTHVGEQAYQCFVDAHDAHMIFACAHDTAAYYDFGPMEPFISGMEAGVGTHWEVVGKGVDDYGHDLPSVKIFFTYQGIRGLAMHLTSEECDTVSNARRRLRDRLRRMCITIGPTMRKRSANQFAGERKLARHGDDHMSNDAYDSVAQRFARDNNNDEM